MKVYIAGKITGDPGYRDKFAAAEMQLFWHGHTVDQCECGGKYTARAFLYDRVRSSCDKEANHA